MTIVRLPRFIEDGSCKTSMEEGVIKLHFDERVDLRGGDIVVYSNGDRNTVNGVSISVGDDEKVTLVAVIGEDPSCRPKMKADRIAEESEDEVQ